MRVTVPHACMHALPLGLSLFFVCVDITFNSVQLYFSDFNMHVLRGLHRIEVLKRSTLSFRDAELHEINTELVQPLNAKTSLSVGSREHIL